MTILLRREIAANKHKKSSKLARKMLLGPFDIDTIPNRKRDINAVTFTASPGTLHLHSWRFVKSWLKNA